MTTVPQPDEQPAYLEPYARVARQHGADFRALLWASRDTQRARFDAMIRLENPRGLSVLDLGCGRADFLEFMIEHDVAPASYVGIEGVDALAAQADTNVQYWTRATQSATLSTWHGRPPPYIGGSSGKHTGEAPVPREGTRATIVRADFVEHPDTMNTSADIIFCSGALNTIEPESFYRALRSAFAAARQAIVFNFLESAMLAGADYLFWHERRDVLQFARSLTPDVDFKIGYVEGDCTVVMRKGVMANAVMHKAGSSA